LHLLDSIIFKKFDSNKMDKFSLNSLLLHVLFEGRPWDMISVQGH
jgi:hypothetical protein